MSLEIAWAIIAFLSTLSLRRATMIHPHLCDVKSNFYPRSPCGERHDTSSLMQCQVKFLSTLSLRRATHTKEAHIMKKAISIHALLAESDHFDNFNLHCVEISIHALLAESDTVLTLICDVIAISIHALLAESDAAS